MQDEGYIPIQSRRFGVLAALRRKQWWSFEGLDPQQELYFVFLALQGFPTSYVSIKVIDYGKNQRWTEEKLGRFQTLPGPEMNITAEGEWGVLHFEGSYEEGWQAEVQTSHLSASFRQSPQAPAHRDRLLTQHLDYNILQFVSNRCQGTLELEGQEHFFNGYGYCEHNWGVQPRHSTAHWLHFWTPQSAGVVMDCHYDGGVPHHYTYLWQPERETYLHSPARFTWDQAHPEKIWNVRAPGLELELWPLHSHHTRMKLPPWPAYIDIDYTELLVEVSGKAVVDGKALEIEGLGKFDANWNRW